MPRVHFASADVAAGTQVMLLEDLSSCVQLGLFFGPGSPLNWGKDLKALIAPLPDLSVAKVSALIVGYERDYLITLGVFFCEMTQYERDLCILIVA